MHFYLSSKVEGYFEQHLEHSGPIIINQPTLNSIIIKSQAMNYDSILPYQMSFCTTPSPALQYYHIPQNYLTYTPPLQYPSPDFAYFLPNSLEFEQSQVNEWQENLHAEERQKPSPLKFHFKAKNLQQNKTSTNAITKYAKKNAESNVINQIFSFLSIRSKSNRVLSFLLKGNQELMDLYYQILKQLKKHNKKYINRCYIKSLIEMQPDHMIHAVLRKIDVTGRFGVDLLRKIMRILISYYMRNVCINTILTSAKLDKETKNEHLQRRGEIENYLNYHIKLSSGSR